jgi:hypothetical protein
MKCTCTNGDTAHTGGAVTYNFGSLYDPFLFCAILDVPGRPGHQSFLIRLSIWLFQGHRCGEQMRIPSHG